MSTRRDWSWKNRARLSGWAWLLVPVAPPLLLMVLQGLVLKYLLHRTLIPSAFLPQVPDYQPAGYYSALPAHLDVGPEGTAYRAAGQLQWVSLTYLLLLAGLAALFASGVLVHLARGKIPCDTSARWWTFKSVAWCSMVAVFAVGCAWEMLSHRWIFHLWRFLDKTLGSVLPVERLPGSPPQAMDKVQYVNTVALFGDRVSFVVLMCLAVAVGWTLMSALGAPDCTRTDRLAVSTERLQAALYVIAAGLVVSVLQVAAFYRWAAAFVGPAGSPSAKAAEALVASYVSARGVLMTTLAASIYIPAALIMRREAALLAAAAAPHSEAAQEEWMKRHGLATTPWSHLPQIAAILAPVVAGPLSEVLKAIK